MFEVKPNFDFADTGVYILQSGENPLGCTQVISIKLLCVASKIMRTCILCNSFR